MNKQTFFLVHDQARWGACEAIKNAHEGYVVTIAEPNRNLEQNAKIHAQISDIAMQCRFMGKRFSVEDWKRLLIDAFARIKAAEGEPLKGWGRILPNLDNSGFVQLGVQSRDLKKAEASEFVEYLYAWGTENNVIWSDEKVRVSA